MEEQEEERVCEDVLKDRTQIVLFTTEKIENTEKIRNNRTRKKLIITD
jgi:hypothetical protein